MKAAIDLLSMADTQRSAILGDMFDLGENSHRLHAQIGEYAAGAGLQRLFCVSDVSPSSRPTHAAAAALRTICKPGSGMCTEILPPA